MQEVSSSQTAIQTACYRAFHSRCDSPKIFDDFIAYDFVGAVKYETFKSQMLAGFKAAAPHLIDSFPDEDAVLKFMMQAMATPALTLSRARYAEDKLQKCVQQGVQQYVILGAGMDTFAFRMHELMAELSVIEVDHPATQKVKRLRLNQLGWASPPQLHFVPIDFTKDKLAEVLTASVYDQTIPGFFSWLGVSYYLPEATVMGTLQSIAAIAPAGSMLVFDYLDTDILVPDKSTPRSQQILWLAEQIGEPVKGLFDPALLAENLAAVGLRLKENLNPAMIQERFFAGRSDNYYACENAHLACAVVM